MLNYEEKLRQLIQTKVEGREIVAAPPVEEPRVIDPMDALKKSLEAHGRTPEAAAKPEPARKKMAASARPRSAAHHRKRKTG
jgi:DNA end-binding protein Ku